MIPSKIKIESFAKRCHMGTLGGKGLNTSEDNISFASSFRDGNIISSSGKKNSLKCKKIRLTMVD